MSYLNHLQPFMDDENWLNDFLQFQDERLIFADALDLYALAQEHGTPLEISFCPMITRRVHAMVQCFETAAATLDYRGRFVYAYATKANFAAEVVRTTLAAGAHYETSSAFDVRIAERLWHNGVLSPDCFVFCNGSKEAPYIEAILSMRQAGFANIMPILDDLDEFEALAACPEPLLLGVRERKDPGDLAEGTTYGADRFGLLPEEMAQLAACVAATPHRIVLYHAMVGSQIEDRAMWTREVVESLDGYARLRLLVPTLDYFNFGGGMPTGAYSLAFGFDYAEFARYLLEAIGGWCDARHIPHPHVVGEFGRYTVADHGVHVFSVGRIKPGHAGNPPWYLLDGSLMVALPDILIVEGQQFIALPLNYFDAPAGPVVLGGRRTCDSDDFYPRPGNPPLVLPLLTDEGRTTKDESTHGPLLIAFFGTGAYQAMLSGEGGAHHCLAPEAPKLVIEEQNGMLVSRIIAEQSWEDVIGELGYNL